MARVLSKSTLEPLPPFRRGMGRVVASEMRMPPSALLPILAAASIALAGAAPAGEPRFVDRSASLPVEHVYSGGWEHFVGGGVAVFDCDGDRFAELFVAGGAEPARLFANRTERPGKPIAFGLGTIPEITGVTGAYPLDIDGDGHLDLAVLRVGPNVLLRGQGDCRFSDATEDWGFAAGNAWSTAFAATWEAGQRLPTLAVGNYVDREDPKGPFMACDENELHRPVSDHYASPVALAPGWCALSMLVSDWARTGRRDLRISNDRHYYVKGGREEMWRLDTLTPLGPKDDWPTVSLWGMGIASRDLTGDGRPEVMLTSMGDQLLQIATPDGYVAAPYTLGTYAQRPHVGDDGRPSTGWHAEFGDIDNDGRDDLFIAKGNVDQMPDLAAKDPNNLLMQQPDGTFREAAAEAGVASTERSRGAGLYDLNLDGRLDLVVVNRRAPMEVWENATEGGAALSLALEQPAPNPDAVGAWIELRTPAGTQTREVTVGGGHVSGQAGYHHFGVGASAAAEIRVTWPDGTVSEWTPLPVPARGRLLRTERGIRFAPDRSGSDGGPGDVVDHGGPRGAGTSKLPRGCSGGAEGKDGARARDPFGTAEGERRHSGRARWSSGGR